MEEGCSSDGSYKCGVPGYTLESMGLDIRFAKVVVARSVDSMSLPAAGAHQGKESTGRLIPLKLGASNGASQK